MDQNQFETYMRDKLVPQVVLYMSACGFNSEKAFALFKTQGNNDSFKDIEQVMQTHSDVLKEKYAHDAVTMYGMFYDCPEKFFILPGHKTLIENFANLMKRQTEPKASKRKNMPPSRFPFGCPPSSLLSSKSLDSNEPEKESDSSLDSYQTTGCGSRTSTPPSTMKDGEHYTVNVFPSTSKSSDGTYAVCASITCHICSMKLHLPVAASKFRPANYYRHVKSCVSNKKRKRKGEKKQAAL